MRLEHLQLAAVWVVIAPIGATDGVADLGASFEHRDMALQRVFAGEVGIYHPDPFPGPEFGWMVTAEAEGKGIALEAAQAALAWVGETFDWPYITSIIDPDNARSIALGLRLGGTVDATLPGVDPGDVVIRHDLRGVA